MWHGFTQMSTYGANGPVIVERAEGRELIDVDGRRYLDAISSLWVTTLGHRVPELDAALVEQLAKVAHTTMLGNGNRVVVELAEALRDKVPVPDAHFLFASDGAAAVEQAIKIAFQYWRNRGIEGRSTFAGLGEAYHGDTVGSLSIGADGFGSDLFGPLRFAVARTPGYNDPGWADKAVALVESRAHELAAFILEPLVQGAAGMLVADPADVRAVSEACRANDVLLVADEVATGFGRTGKLFASEWCGIEADLMAIGKGIAGGYLAMSATVAAGHVFDAFLGEDLGPKTLYHGHSFGGNALAAAVALRHLQLIDEWDVLDNVLARAAQFEARLAAAVAPLAAVGAIRQCGLMVGVELAPPTPGLRWGRRVCAAAVDRGVLLRALGDVVVAMPPLTTTADEVDRIVDTLAAAIGDVATHEAALP